MNQHALAENIKTLMAISGLDHASAVASLEVVVTISAPSNDATALRFAELLKQLLSRTVTTVLVNPSSSTPRVEVIINSNKPVTAGIPLWVSLSNDNIVINGTVPETQNDGNGHPAFLLLGACYAAARVLKAVAGDQLPISYADPLSVNIKDLFGADFNFETSINLGTAYLAGAGAIGNGFLLALSLLNVEGELHIADPDVVDDRNLNRCVWFTEEDVGKNKAKQLAALCQPTLSKLVLTPHDCVLKSVPRPKENARWLRRLIVAVDSRRVRRSLQSEIPGEVYDASTTDIREIVLHFNKQPLEELACLSCIYAHNVDESAHEKHVAELLGVRLEDVRENFVSRTAAIKICERYPQFSLSHFEGAAYDSLFKQLCGEGALNSSENRNVLAPFSFISVLAGVFLALELQRRINQKSIVEPFNYWKVNPWHNPLTKLRKIRNRNPNCEFCGDPILGRVAREIWVSAHNS